MRLRRPLALTIVLLAALHPGAPLGAQEGAPGAARTTAGPPLVLIGSPLEERGRLSELLGGERTGEALIRSASGTTRPRADSARAPGIELLYPAVESVWNSRIPVALNDGALWAGRGANVSVTGGALVDLGPTTLVLLPDLTYSENRAFERPATRLAGRSSFAAPWYVGSFSTDLPIRFGDQPVARLGPGQSSLSVRAGPARLGAGTESQWWGPGIRNAIVLGNSAPGFPHLFAGTAAPLRTRLGAFSGKWIGGFLTESLYFDTVAGNDRRAISGAIATYTPALEPDLTVGAARTVVATAPDRELSLAGLTGALSRWRNTDNSADDPAFQLLSLFARWVFPADGFEAYAEWARVVLPSSPLELLSSPEYSQGYTLGIQWAREIGRERYFRLQSEITYLEEGATHHRLPTRSFYVSPAVPQGYTERGQSLGASIGPGASSQWLAADLFGPRARAGLFLGRARLGNDVYYALPPGQKYFAHDVDVFAGARVGVRLFGVEGDGSARFSRRYNFLFQNPANDIYGREAVDVSNVTFQLSVYPASGPLAPRVARGAR